MTTATTPAMAAAAAALATPLAFSLADHVLSARMRTKTGAVHWATGVEILSHTDARIELSAHFGADARPASNATLSFFVRKRDAPPESAALVGRVRAGELPAAGTSAEFLAPGATWVLACLASLGRLWRSDKALMGTHPSNLALAAMAGFNPAMVEWRGTFSSVAGAGSNHGIVPVIGWGVFDPTRDPALARGNVTIATRRYAADESGGLVVEAGTIYELALEMRWTAEAAWTRVASVRLPAIPRGGRVCGPIEAYVSFASDKRERRRTIVQMVMQVPRAVIAAAIE